MLDLATRINGNGDAAVAPTERQDFLLVSDRADGSADLAAILSIAGEVTQVSLSELEQQTPGHFRLFVDLDLSDVGVASRLRQAIERSQARATPRYFVTGTDHHTRTQAIALKAFAMFSRPFKQDRLLHALRRDSSTAFQERLHAGREPVCGGIAAAHSVLMQVFEGLPAGHPLTLDDVLAQERHIIDALRSSGMKSWLDVVNGHHNSSYRHCLSVTGFAVAFAQHLGFNVADQQRLARCALLHDVGKAFIPIEILDKPAKLTDPEMALMQTHALLGFDALRNQGGFPRETLDVVLHHHELLDGSGYPSGLRGAEISDTVRMVTIADIYSALVEERAYRAAMPAPDAFAILAAMDGKLDRHLVEAFRPVALGES